MPVKLPTLILGEIKWNQLNLSYILCWPLLFSLFLVSLLKYQGDLCTDIKHFLRIGRDE
jgi:hypothetical protein